MSRVRHLVGFHPDEARLNGCDNPMQITRAPGLFLTPERFPHNRGEERDELPRPTNLHFDQQGLALMQAHAASRPDGLMPPLIGAALLIEGVATFMQDCHKGRYKGSLV